MSKIFNHKIKGLVVLVIATVSIISLGIVIQSCNSEDEFRDDIILRKYENQISKDLFNYFNSLDYADLNKSFDISSKDRRWMVEMYDRMLFYGKTSLWRSCAMRFSLRYDKFNLRMYHYYCSSMCYLLYIKSE